MGSLPSADDISRPAPRVTSAPNISVAQDTGLQSLGQGLESFSESYRKVKNFDDKVKTEDAYNKLLQAKLELSIGDDGFSSVQSEQASSGTVYKDYMDRFTKQVESLASGLGNDNQKRMFESRANIATQQYGTGLVTHIQAQKKVYAKQVYDSGLEMEKQTAAANAHSPSTIKMSVERSNRLIDGQAENEGWPAVTKKQKKLEATSEIHIGVINNMLSAENEQAADLYYKKHKKSIQGTSHDEIESALDAGSIRGQSQELADQILDQALSDGESREAVRTLTKTKPKLRDAVSQRVETELSRRSANMAAEAKENKAIALKFINTNHSLEGFPVDMWDSFNQQEQASLKALEKQLIAGTPTVTVEKVFNGLRQLQATDSEEFMNRDIELLDGPYLSASDLRTVVDRQSRLIEGEADAQNEIKDIQSQENVINTQLLISGIDPKDKGNQAEVGTIKSIIYDRINALQRSTGKKASTEDVQGIVDAMTIEGEVPGLIWDTDKRFYEVYGTGLQGVFTPDLVDDLEEIPIIERSKLMDAIRANGGDLTAAAMIDLYNRKTQAMINAQ